MSRDCLVGRRTEIWQHHICDLDMSTIVGTCFVPLLSVVQLSQSQNILNSIKTLLYVSVFRNLPCTCTGNLFELFCKPHIPQMFAVTGLTSKFLVLWLCFALFRMLFMCSWTIVQGLNTSRMGESETPLNASTSCSTKVSYRIWHNSVYVEWIFLVLSCSFEGVLVHSTRYYHVCLTLWSLISFLKWELPLTVQGFGSKVKLASSPHVDHQYGQEALSTCLKCMFTRGADLPAHYFRSRES